MQGAVLLELLVVEGDKPCLVPAEEFCVAIAQREGKPVTEGQCCIMEDNREGARRPNKSERLRSATEITKSIPSVIADDILIECLMSCDKSDEFNHSLVDSVQKILQHA